MKTHLTLADWQWEYAPSMEESGVLAAIVVVNIQQGDTIHITIFCT